MEHKCQKGFTHLTLGWSDGYSFIPTGFNMLSSAEKSNRYNEVSENIDHRTNGFKFRKESMMHKTVAAILLIKNALSAGVKADFVRNIFGSLVISTKTGIPVKIVLYEIAIRKVSVCIS